MFWLPAALWWGEAHSCVRCLFGAAQLRVRVPAQANQVRVRPGWLFGLLAGICCTYTLPGCHVHTHVHVHVHTFT